MHFFLSTHSYHEQRGEDRELQDNHKEAKFSNNNPLTIIKGLVVGGTMLVPGVSGGSMAIILGIYDDLIYSVSSFMKHKGASLRFLILFSAGGILGMFLLSRPILYLLDEFTMPTLYFFMGAVIGSVPMIFSKSELKKFSIRGLFYVIAGIAVVVAISFIPASGSESSLDADLTGMLFLALAGFVAAIALVLPGISVSYLLLIMGLYDETVTAISQVYMPFLLPLGIGLILGIVLTTKILEKAMTEFPQPTYLMILGFVLGSLAEVFPGIPAGMEMISCLIALAAGTGIILFISRKF